MNTILKTVTSTYTIIIIALFQLSLLIQPAQAQTIPDCNPSNTKNLWAYHYNSSGAMVGGIKVENTSSGIVASAFVRNNSLWVPNGTPCRAKVGMASFFKYDEIFINQERFDSVANVYIMPDQQVELKVKVPTCAAQLDVYQGDELFIPTDDNTFCPHPGASCRLLADYHSNLKDFKCGLVGNAVPRRCLNPLLTGSAAVPYCTRRPPTCNAGGPYTSGLECSPNPKTVTLDGSRSTGSTLSYAWTSSCPTSSLTNRTSVRPSLTVPTLTSSGGSLSCNVSLSVTDKWGLSSSCSAQIQGGSCNFDCAGTLNGTAKLDTCGVCNGDGTSCIQCTSKNIEASLHAADVALAKMRAGVQRLTALSIKSIGIVGLKGREASSLRVAINKDNTTSNKAYLTGWQLIFSSIPGVILTCGNKPGCSTVSTTSATSAVAAQSSTIQSSAQRVYAKLDRILKRAPSRLSKQVKALRAKGKTYLNATTGGAKEVTAVLNSIPGSHSSCN